MDLNTFAGIIAAFLSPMLGHCDDKFPATDPCSLRIRLLDTGNIDPAERYNSDGKIEACIPAPNPQKKLNYLEAKNEEVAQRFKQAYGRYLAVRSKVDKIQADLISGGGSICGATAAVKDDVKSVVTDMVNAVAEIETQLKAFQATEFSFNEQYSKRMAATLKAKFKDPGSCSNTGKNVATISKAFSATDEACTKTFQDTNSALKAVTGLYLSLNACK